MCLGKLRAIQRRPVARSVPGAGMAGSLGLLLRAVLPVETRKPVFEQPTGKGASKEQNAALNTF